MVVKLFGDAGIEVINIVRKDEQVETLHNIGCKYILNSESVGFDENLKELCKKLSPSVFFDAVGGELTGKIAKYMPQKSTVYVYGNLSNKACEISTVNLIFHGKVVKGFYLGSWIQH